MAQQRNDDDVSSSYMEESAKRTQDNEVREFETWLKSVEQGMSRLGGGESPETAPGVPTPDQIGDPPRSGTPATPPLRRRTDDQLGRPPVDKNSQSTLGTVMRNVSEIPKQILGGVDDAVHNALSFLDPLAKWLDENVVDTRYTPISKPGTVTGNVTRKMSEFLTGFVPALKGIRALGATGKVAPPMMAGAISDFAVRNPQEARLSDLWKEMNLPQNILTDFLSSKPDDTGTEARLKNAAEGVLIGGTLEGFMAGVRAIRAAKAVPGAKQAETDLLKARYGEITEEQSARLFGGPKTSVFQTAAKEIENSVADVAGRARIDPEALIRKYPRGPQSAPKPTSSGDFDVFINFNHIDSPDQVKFAIGKMADLFKGRIDDATRGTITQQETAKLAEEMGLTVTDILSRQKGQPWNAETALAARQVWAASAEQLVAAAKAASGPSASALDKFQFRKLMAVHQAIQQEVIGARTETARALNSWKIDAGGSGVEKARAVDQVLTAMGGPEHAQELARRLAILAESGADPAAIARFADRGAASATMDAVREVWVNGLLSSPKTHVVNVSSNLLVTFQQIMERGAAAQIRNFTGGEGVVAGEATAMAYGAVESIKDAWKLAAKSLKTGETSLAFNKVDTLQTNALSSEAFRMSKETGLGRFVDFLGSVTRVPQRLLGAEDEFFKTIGYRMELRAQALRTATQEGHKGAALATRIDDIIRNPPDHIKIASADSALYNTFTNETGAFGKAVMSLRNIDSPLNPAMFILPFVRTPVNIARYAFERSPLAPLVGQWRADIAAGGARADLALARMSTGTAVMVAAMDFADRGLITGEGPKGHADRDVREGLMRQGWQQYSLKIGDRWYSYNRTDPFGMTVGLAASIAEAVRKGEIDENDVDEWHEVTAMAIAAVSQVTISKTYLNGFAQFVEVMSDPKRYSQSYVQNLIASFTPATSLMSTVKGAVDPIQRETNNPMEAVMARIAGLSSKLPPRRNLWGEPVSTASGLGDIYDAVTPVQSKAIVDSPIDREIVRLDAGPLRINKTTMFDGVNANMKMFPQAYDDYTRLAGNGLKHPAWGVGAKDLLNSIVSGKHPLSASYNILSDDSRRAFISNTLSDYRKMAQQQILNDPRHINFANEIHRLKQINLGGKMPVLE